MRPAIHGVKTASWQVAPSTPNVPAMGGRPPIAASPVTLSEGPIVEERVFRVRAWGVLSDRARVAKIRRMAEDYGNDPRLRWWVVNEVLRPSGVQPMDFRGQLNAMFTWVQAHIYYTNESTEQIQSPWWTIKHRTGDCDDMALLLASMAVSLGFPFKLAIAGKHKVTGQFVRWIDGEPSAGPVQFTHIYLFVADVPLDPENATWWAMEPTLRGVPLGYDVTLHGPGATGRADLGASYGGPVFGDPYGALPPATTARAQEIAQLRALPPLEAIQVVGMRQFIGEWLDWHRLSSSVVEGTLTALAIGAVLSFGPRWARRAAR
jgi:hypothetical protein